MFSRVFEHLQNQEAKAACMLPNVARYQLRHTPKCEKYSIFLLWNLERAVSSLASLL